MFLVVGANGQLGSELRRQLGDKAEYADRSRLDITDESAVKEFFSRREYDFVINAAAYTAVDAAETDHQTAAAVNTAGSRNLAAYGKRVIYISTDYVFNGRNRIPYTETDTPDPLNFYGRSKLDGETAVLQYASTAAVVRTSWLYSPFGRNFVKTMLQLGREKNELRVVSDQIGSPTCAGDLAAALIVVAGKLPAGSHEIYHYSNEGSCSWCEFATEIMRCRGLECRVVPVLSHEYPTAAERPRFSVLSKEKIKKDFNLIIPHWKESLQKCLQQF